MASLPVVAPYHHRRHHHRHLPHWVVLIDQRVFCLRKESFEMELEVEFEVEVEVEVEMEIERQLVLLDEDLPTKASSRVAEGCLMFDSYFRSS